MSALVVARVAGPAAVQDAGRPGRMHEGVPPGGALVPALLARANAAAGNAPGAAALECFGAIALVARGEVTVGLDDGRALAMRDGERLEVEAPRAPRVRYVAVRGGVDVPVVLGGRGTLVVAGLGGHEGRWLRAGDTLPVGDAPTAATSMPDFDLDEIVLLVPGPDHARFRPEALATLLGERFEVGRGDRTGTRLVGPPLARADADDGVSAPMVRGAIQVPSSGEPIVLGPDHPTTGGYPVLAVVLRAHHGLVEARPPGAVVRFGLAGGRLERPAT